MCWPVLKAVMCIGKFLLQQAQYEACHRLGHIVFEHTTPKRLLKLFILFHFSRYLTVVDI